jgi:ABC-type multidrug transport system ATPase subunit
MIEAQHLVARRGMPDALHEVGIRVAPGTCLGVASASSGSKSTLLRVLAGLERPDAGTIRLRGHEAADTASLRRGITYASRDTAALGVGLRVDEFLRFVAGVRASMRPTADTLRDLARMLHLDPRDPVARLSAAQRGALAMASALMVPCDVLMLDCIVEDVEVRAQDAVAGALAATRERGIAMLIASADASLLDRLCDDVILLHDGRITATRSLAAETQ